MRTRRKLVEERVILILLESSAVILKYFGETQRLAGKNKQIVSINDEEQHTVSSLKKNTSTTICELEHGVCLAVLDRQIVLYLM